MHNRAGPGYQVFTRREVRATGYPGKREILLTKCAGPAMPLRLAGPRMFVLETSTAAPASVMRRIGIRWTAGGDHDGSGTYDYAA